MRFAGLALVVGLLGFCAGLGWSRREAAVPFAAALPPTLVAGALAVEGRGAAQRVADALALAKDDPLRMEHDLWAAAQSLTAAEARAFSGDAGSFLKLANQLNSIGQSEGLAAIRTVIDRWLELDPEGAMAQLESVELPHSSETPAGVIMRVCAQRDPEALLARGLRERPDGIVVLNVVWAVFSELGEKNPSLGRALLERVPADSPEKTLDLLGMGADLRGKALAAFEYGRSEADPFFGLALASKQAPGDREKTLGHVSQLLAKRGAAEVERAIRLDPNLHPQEVSVFLSALAAQDANAAADLVLALDPARINGSTARSVAGELAQRDRLLASDWLEKLPDEYRDNASEMVAGIWAERDPEEALEWLAANDGKNPATQFRNGMERAFGYWLQTDEPAARAWLATQTGKIAAKLESSLFSFFANTDRADEAARHISASPQYVDWAAGTVGAALGRNDPASAAEWAASLPDGLARDRAVLGVFREWLDRDETAAAQWICTFPEGGILSSAAQDMVKKNAALHPVEAAAWVEKIAPSELRTDSARILFEKWRQSDPAAAREWFSTVPGLPGYLRAAILNQ